MMRSVNLALMEAANARRRAQAQFPSAAAYLHIEEPGQRQMPLRVAPDSQAVEPFVISLNGDDA